MGRLTAEQVFAIGDEAMRRTKASGATRCRGCRRRMPLNFHRPWCVQWAYTQHWIDASEETVPSGQRVPIDGHWYLKEGV